MRLAQTQVKDQMFQVSFVRVGVLVVLLRSSMSCHLERLRSGSDAWEYLVKINRLLLVDGVLSEGLHISLAVGVNHLCFATGLREHENEG